MKTKARKTLLVAASFAALALALVVALTPTGQAAAQGMMNALMVAVTNDAAHPVPVNAIRPAADRVMLRSSAIPNPGCTVGHQSTVRCLPDASCESVPFVVPAGKVLVITDVQGRIFEDVGWSPGEVATLSVVVKDGPMQTFLPVRGEVTPGADVSQVLALSAHFQSGELAGPGTNVCVIAGNGTKTGTSAAGVSSAEIHGYFIDE